MKNRSLSFWLFLTPTLVALSLVVIIPVIMGLFYSFTNWDGIAFTEMVGFKLTIIVSDHDFINAFWFTVKFAITTVILLNAIGLSLALLVAKTKPVIFYGRSSLCPHDRWRILGLSGNFHYRLRQRSIYVVTKLADQRDHRLWA